MNLWGRSAAGKGEGTGAGERRTFAKGEKPQVRIRMGEGAPQKRRRLARLVSVTGLPEEEITGEAQSRSAWHGDRQLPLNTQSRYGKESCIPGRKRALIQTNRIYGSTC